MTTYTYSGFAVSDVDLEVFQGWLNFLAASKATTEADLNSLTTDAGIFWVGGANSLSFLSFIYDAMVDDTGIIGEFFLYGYGCYDDTNFALAETETKTMKYCDFAYPQIWKAVLILLANTLWWGMIFGVSSYQYFWKSAVEGTEGGYQKELDKWAKNNQNWGSDYKAPG